MYSIPAQPFTRATVCPIFKGYPSQHLMWFTVLNCVRSIWYLCSAADIDFIYLIRVLFSVDKHFILMNLHVKENGFSNNFMYILFTVSEQRLACVAGSVLFYSWSDHTWWRRSRTKHQYAPLFQYFSEKMLMDLPFLFLYSFNMIIQLMF